MRTMWQRGHGLLLFIRKSRDGAVRLLAAKPEDRSYGAVIEIVAEAVSELL